MKELENELEILQIQEDYLKDEQKHLKSEYIRSKEEVFLSLLNCLDQAYLECVPRNWKLC